MTWSTIKWRKGILCLCLVNFTYRVSMVLMSTSATMLGCRTQWTLTNCTVWFECNGFGFPLATDSSHGAVPLSQLPQSSHFSLWPTAIGAQNNNLRRGQYTHTYTYTHIPVHTSLSTGIRLQSDFSFLWLWPGCEGSYSVCLLLCASHSGKEKFYELVIVVVALVEHDTPFVCAINIFLLFLLLFPRRCLGQLLIGSSKFHCLAFKLQLFAVKMVINIDRESEWERVYLLSAMHRLTHGQSMRGGGWYKRNREWKPVYVFGSWHNETPGRLCRKLASALMISRRGSSKYMTRKRI